jgi:hypothetical protein
MKASVIGLLSALLLLSADIGWGQVRPHDTSVFVVCSPAPCVLPPTQASDGGSLVNTSPIVADPLDPGHVLLGAYDYNCASGLGLFTSAEGGSSWNQMCATQDIGPYSPTGPPLVGYDRNGVAYIAGVYFHAGYDTGLVGIQASKDGLNWSEPVAALHEGEFPAMPWLTVDTSPTSPYLNALYVSAVIESYASDAVWVSHSNDGGTTWQEVRVIPPQTGLSQDYFTTMNTAKDGTVYLGWEHCVGKGSAAGCLNGTGYILLSKSTDGGNSWSDPILMTKVAIGPEACKCGVGALPNTNDIGVDNYAAIGVDNSDGPYAGTVYASMYSWTGSNMQVQVVRSTDSGNTWFKPVAVAPPSDTHDQFFPWLSVSPTGLVGVSWLDRRNDPNNIDYQAFAAISTDGGQSFQPNIQLTTKFSNPNNNGYPNEGWMGDYTGNTWAGPNYFVAAWMDSSNGVNMQDVVGGIRLK